MANPESISYIRLNDVEYPIDAVTVGRNQQVISRMVIL